MERELSEDFSEFALRMKISSINKEWGEAEKRIELYRRDCDQQHGVTLSISRLRSTPDREKNLIIERAKYPYDARDSWLIPIHGFFFTYSSILLLVDNSRIG